MRLPLEAPSRLVLSAAAWGPGHDAEAAATAAAAPPAGLPAMFSSLRLPVPAQRPSGNLPVNGKFNAPRRPLTDSYSEEHERHVT